MKASSPWKTSSFFKKRATILLFCFLVVFSLGIVSFVYLHTFCNRELRKVTRELLNENLKDNSLIAHFTVSDLEKAGLDDPAAMPVYSKENSRAEREELLALTDRLNEIDLSDADLKESLLRDSLSFYLAHMLKLSEYSYFEEPFSPNSGIQNELPILLTEFAFQNKEDVERYLEILSLLPDYLNSLCQYEKEKAEHNMFMSDEMADRVIASLDHFRNLSDIDNPFLTTFETRLKELVAAGKITTEEYRYYIEENTRLISTMLMPAYEKTGDALTLLKTGKREQQRGLCCYQNGSQYYELLVSSTLGEDINIPALKNAFSRKLMSDFTELNKLLESNPQYFISLMGNETQADPLRSLTPEQCIELLREAIREHFPAASVKTYPCTLKDVAPSMEEFTNPAYYFTPPIDDPSQNVIYINRSQTPEGISLFTTLAHEGFPGHLYQAVTSSRSLASANLPSLSGIAYFGGYTEGYATYVEFLSYEYAKDAAAQITGNENASLYYDYLAYNRSISLNLYSILDIMIHYENATPADIRPYLYKIGITEDADIKTIYDYIVMEPGTYITYYGGYLKILECKNLAMECWGDAYNDKAFHQLLLNLGPQSFENIRKYIKETRPSSAGGLVSFDIGDR